MYMPIQKKLRKYLGFDTLTGGGRAPVRAYCILPELGKGIASLGRTNGSTQCQTSVVNDAKVLGQCFGVRDLVFASNDSRTEYVVFENTEGALVLKVIVINCQ